MSRGDAYNGRECPACGQMFANVACLETDGVLECVACNKVWKTCTAFERDCERRDREAAAPPSAEDRAQALRAGLAGLRGMEESIHDREYADLRWVKQFHRYLDDLTAAGLRVGSFRVRREELFNLPDASGIHTPEPGWVQVAMLRAKIRAVLDYLAGLLRGGERPEPIGFKPPRA